MDQPLNPSVALIWRTAPEAQGSTERCGPGAAFEPFATAEPAPEPYAYEDHTRAATWLRGRAGRVLA